MIHVLKTSVKTKAQVKRLVPLLNTLVEPSGRWNFDLDDVDRILRVESTEVRVEAVIHSLVKEGYVCEEL